MMGFVVQDQNGAAFGQIAQHALRESRRAFRTFVDHGIRLAALGVFGLWREEMPVGDEHFAGVQERAQTGGHQLEGRVIVIQPIGP